MCLRLLRTTQSLLRLVSRPLLIVQQTTQHRDESRAASVSTNAQTTFNHRNPGQISRLSCSQIGEKKKKEKEKASFSVQVWETSATQTWTSGLQMENSPFKKRPAFNFHTASNLLAFHLRVFMPIQECSIHKECRNNTQKGFYVRSTWILSHAE